MKGNQDIHRKKHWPTGRNRWWVYFGLIFLYYLCQDIKNKEKVDDSS